VALRAWVMDIAHRMQCPADFPAVAALVALSSLIGARAVIQPKAKDDWQVVPNLWGAVVGRPGVKKSPALGEALKPLNRLQAAEFELWQAAHEAWALDCKVTAMQDDANEKKAKGLATKDPAAARQLLAPMDTPAEPTARRYIVNDATVEKLGELMQQNEWGTLSYRDELYGLLTGLDKQGQEGSRAFYLQSYDGNQGYTFDRIGRGTVHIPRVCLAMIGGIQPGRIQEYVRGAVAGGSADDGLLQRFGLTVWPDVTGDFVHVDQWPDTPAKQTAWAVFDRLAQLQPASDTEPVIWRFSPDAQALFVEWLIPFETEIRGDDLHPAMVSHLSKYRKLIPALALVFALIDTPDSGGVIHEAELIRALAMGDYLRTHANRLYAAAVIPETTDAVTLLSKIKAGRLADSDGVIVDSFTPRQVAVKHWAGLATPEAVRKAADMLADYDWLRRDVVQAGAAGGRPSDRYQINPALLKGGTA
jgi:putative DNA primase/helicase